MKPLLIATLLAATVLESAASMLIEAQVALHRRVAYQPPADAAAHLLRFTGLIEQTGFSAEEKMAKGHWLLKEMLAISNVQFVGEVFMGHKLESYDMIFDTGSPYLWIAHRDSNFMKPVKDQQFTRKSFQCFESPTCHYNPEHREFYSIQYGEGLTQGVVVADKFSVGGGLVNDDTQFLIALKADGSSS